MEEKSYLSSMHERLGTNKFKFHWFTREHSQIPDDWISNCMISWPRKYSRHYNLNGRFLFSTNIHEIAKIWNYFSKWVSISNVIGSNMNDNIIMWFQISLIIVYFSRNLWNSPPREDLQSNSMKTWQMFGYRISNNCNLSIFCKNWKTKWIFSLELTNC